MSNGVRVAAAVGAGYVLGRTRKMRLAFMLAAAGVTGKFPARPSDLMVQGLKSLGASDQLNQLGDQLRGELLGAARAAAVAAATSQVDALNDRLQGVTADLGADEALEDTRGAAQRTTRKAASTLGVRRRAPVPEPEDYDNNVDTFEDLDEDQIDETEDTLDEDDEEEDVDEDQEPEPTLRRRSTLRQTAPAKSATRRSTRAQTHEEPRAKASRRRSSAEAPVRRGR